MGRARTLALAALVLAFGFAAEWASWDPDEIRFGLTDVAVGCLLVACGAVASLRRPDSRVGGLMTLTSATWFAGSVFAPLAFLHRGPLVHLQLSYPTGRIRGRLVGAVVVGAYVVSAVEPLARNDVLTIVLGAAVAATAIRVFAGASGPARKAAGPALVAALAFSAVLTLGAVERLAGWGLDDQVLWAYDAVVAFVAVVLLADLLRGRWADAVVTGLVVDLGAERETTSLRARLARALGDPSLVIAYRLGEQGGYVDDDGTPVDLPTPGTERTTTPLKERGQEIAVLVHDEALLADPQLVGAVAAAARIALANARLQAEARAKAVELEASRRRIVEAADAQRRRIQAELELGAGRRLERVATLLAGARAADGDTVAPVEAALAGARAGLEEFARGVHPGALAEGGLEAALAQLAERAAVPVELRGTVRRLPAAIEAALFFVCSEALANVAKHARASRAVIEVRETDGSVRVEVADDGEGGAVAARGSGLAGLADRVEALGGALRIDSPRGRGTRIAAEIPV